MPKPPLMERSIFALTHILVEALPDIRWTRLMALRTGNFMARKILSNAQAIAEQSEFEGQNFGFSPATKPQQKLGHFFSPAGKVNGIKKCPNLAKKMSQYG